METGIADEENVFVPPVCGVDDEDRHLLLPSIEGREASRRSTCGLPLRHISAALIQETVKGLPVQPERISAVEGPILHISKADESTKGTAGFDVQIVHKFRAHFSAGLEQPPSLLTLGPGGSSLPVNENTVRTVIKSLKATPSSHDNGGLHQICTSADTKAASVEASSPFEALKALPWGDDDSNPSVSSCRDKRDDRQSLKSGAVMEEMASLKRVGTYKDMATSNVADDEQSLMALDLTSLTKIQSTSLNASDQRSSSTGRTGTIILADSMGVSDYPSVALIPKASSMNAAETLTIHPGVTELSLNHDGAAGSHQACQSPKKGKELLPVTRQDQVMRTSIEWEIDPSQLTVGRRVAIGGFSEVFIGKYNGTLVAIKRLFAIDSETIQRFIHEVRILARLRHPNLILWMGFIARPEPCIITEYMARGSLFKLLSQRRASSSLGGPSPPPLESKLTRSIVISVARGMAYLHSRTPPILHMDLKSPNILIDDKWRFKIADFGLSLVRQGTYVSSGNAGGTPEWMAPEVLRCERYDERADIYSYGVVLWEVLTGRVPWEHLNAMQVVGAVGFANASLPQPEKDSREPFLIDLCIRCMRQSPELRPDSFQSILEVLEMHYGPGGGLNNGADDDRPLALLGPDRSNTENTTILQANNQDLPIIVDQQQPFQELEQDHHAYMLDKNQPLSDINEGGSPHYCRNSSSPPRFVPKADACTHSSSRGLELTDMNSCAVPATDPPTANLMKSAKDQQPHHHLHERHYHAGRFDVYETSA